MAAQFNDLQNWFRVEEVGQLLQDTPQIAPRPVDHIMSSLPFPRTVVQLDEELVLRDFDEGLSREDNQVHRRYCSTFLFSELS